MAEGHSSLEDRADSRTSSGRSPERISQNFEMREPFNPVKKEASTSSCEPPRSVDAPSRMASSSGDAYSNVEAGFSSPDINLPGSPQRMPGSPFVTPIGNYDPNVQQPVETLFGVAEKTKDTRIRVLEAHVLDLQAQNLDLHRRLSVQEGVSNSSTASFVHPGLNTASEEPLKQWLISYVDTRFQRFESSIYSRMDRRDSHVDAQIGYHDSSVESKSEKQEHKYPFIVDGATKREVEMVDNLASNVTGVIQLNDDAASSELRHRKGTGNSFNTPVGSREAGIARNSDILPCETSSEQHAPECGVKLERVVQGPVWEGSHSPEVEEWIGHESRKEVGIQLGGIFNLEIRKIVEIELAKRFRNLAANISNTSVSFMATGGNFKTNSNDTKEAGNDLVSLALQSMVTNTMSRFFESQKERLEVIKDRLNYHGDLLDYANDCTDSSDQNNFDTSRAQFTRNRIEALKSDSQSLGPGVQPGPSGENIPFQTPNCQLDILPSYGPFSEDKGEVIEHAIQHDFDGIMGVNQNEPREQAEIRGLKGIFHDSPLLSSMLPTSQPACIDALEAVIYISGGSLVPLDPSATSPEVSEELPAPPMNSQIPGLEPDVKSIESQLDGGITTLRQRDNLDSYPLESPRSGYDSGHAPGSQEDPVLPVSISRNSPRSLAGIVMVTNAAIDASSKEMKGPSSSLVKDQIHEAMQEELHSIPGQLHALKSGIALSKPGGQSLFTPAHAPFPATTLEAFKKSMSAMSSQVSDLESRIESLEQYADPARLNIQSGHASPYQTDLTTFMEADQEPPSSLVKEKVHEAIQKELHEMRRHIHFLNSYIDLDQSGSQSDPAATRAHLEAPTASEEAMKELPAPVICDPTLRLKSADAATNYDSSADEVKAFLQAEVERAVGLQVSQMHALILMQINSSIELLESGRQSGPIPICARPKLPAPRHIPATPMNFRMLAPPSLVGNPALLQRHFQLELEELIGTQVACFETRMSSRMDRLEYRMSSISLSLSNLWQNVWNLGTSVGGWNTWSLGWGMWNPV